MLKLNKNKARTVKDSINYWSENNIISEEQKSKLLESYIVTNFDFKQFAQYFYLLAVISFLISLFACLSNSGLMQLITKIFYATNLQQSLFFFFIFGCLFYSGLKNNKKSPLNYFKAEAFLIMANISISISLYYFLEYKNFFDRVYKCEIFFATSTLLFTFLTFFSKSKITWILAIFSLLISSAFFVESRRGDFFPEYYRSSLLIMFSLCIIAFSMIFKSIGKVKKYANISFLIGVKFFALCLAFNLIIRLIFSNHDSTKEIFETASLSLSLALTSIYLLYYGIINENILARLSGICFFSCNLITLFILFLCKETFGFSFFAIIAIVLWLIATKAEKIWNLSKEKID